MADVLSVAEEAALFESIAANGLGAFAAHARFVASARAKLPRGLSRGAVTVADLRAYVDGQLLPRVLGGAVVGESRGCPLSEHFVVVALDDALRDILAADRARSDLATTDEPSCGHRVECALRDAVVALHGAYRARRAASYRDRVVLPWLNERLFREARADEAPAWLVSAACVPVPVLEALLGAAPPADWLPEWDLPVRAGGARGGGAAAASDGAGRRRQRGSAAPWWAACIGECSLSPEQADPYVMRIADAIDAS